MLSLILRTLKDRRTSVIIFCAAILGFIWLYISIYPTIKEQSANLEMLLKAYPESLMKAFNIDIRTYTTIEGYLGAEEFSFIWPIMLIFLIIGYAGSSIAGEIDKGTIEVLLSTPLSRLKIFLSKYITGLIILIVFVIFSTFATVPILAAYNIDYNIQSFTTIALLGFMFGLAIYCISIFLSSIFSDKGKVYFITGGILVLMYVLNIIAALKDNLNDLKYFSFFYYFNANKALISQEIDEWAYLVFIGCAVIFSIIAAITFSKRDVAV